MRIVNMPAETAGAVGILSALKWLVGLVLAPWLWHERKRVDELTQKLNEQNNDHYTKEEVKEAINDKTEGLKSAVSELSDKITIIQDTANATNVTIARIDERMKKNAE
tara:strand:+ start:207 stop:530 length:324 start_codon:yes stop_codon:yes gene_type:complete